MNDILLQRRRLMMQSKKSDWIPLMINCYSDESLINYCGNLFETYENAPEKFGGSNATYKEYTKCGAIAISPSVTSTQIGGNIVRYVRIYEDGTLIRILYGGGSVTITWTTGSKARHIITYGTTVTTGNFSNADILSQIVWILTKTQINQPSNVLRQIHYFRDSTSLGYYSADGSVRLTPLGLNRADAIMYYPEKWNNGGNRVQFWFKEIPIIVVPKYGANTSNIYFVYSAPAQFKHMYVRWGIGEVPTKGNWSLFWASGVAAAQKYYTLHIPDLGNAEANTALKNEYISKRWHTYSGSGTTVNIVHSNLPVNPYL